MQVSKRKEIIKTKVESLKIKTGDFPSCPVVKNPPSNAGDTGLIPGWGTKIPHASGQLSLRCNY